MQRAAKIFQSQVKLSILLVVKLTHLYNHQKREKNLS